MKKNHVSAFLATLILLSACQEEDLNLKVSENKDFEPSIVATLETYGLSVSDFETVPTVGKDDASARRGSHVTKKTLAIGNEEIAYYETSGKGPDVLLIHGSAMSSNSYTFQLNSVLGKIFHIISIDLAGHGMSQYSPDPAVAYQLPGQADLLVDIVDELDMEQAVMVGWSLGGNIMLQASDRLTQARGMMILGCSPVANPFDPNAFFPSEEFGLLFKPDLTEEEIEALVSILFRPNATYIPGFFYDDVRAQDPLARLYLGVTVGTGNYQDQVGIVGNLSVPLAVLDGKREQISNIDYQRGLSMPTLWHNKIWEIPNAGHAAQWENPVYFNVLLAAFVIDCNLNS